MQTTWVVTANASKAKIYAISGNKNISLIREFENHEARLKEHDLVTDRPGHFKGNNPARGSFVGSDPKEIEIDRFAKIIIDFLYKEHTNNIFSKLIIIASPPFLGHLKSNYNKNLNAVTKLYLAKDFTYITGQELLYILHEEYHDSL